MFLVNWTTGAKGCTSWMKRPELYCSRRSERGPRNSSWQRASRSFEHYTGDSTIWLDSTPILRENTLEMVRGLPPLFAFHYPQERLAARRLFRVLSCRRNTIHLQTSMPSPGFEPRLYDAADSVTKHSSGWLA
ncbi:hypothetical protein TNCV_523891 [Trichonephila clavipes]|nr:hypothetical protein TNCV_523891 [Trichonephila clavipes]